MPAEEEHQTIIDRLILLNATLPKKQRKLCNYIVKNYHSIGIMTVADLADAADVGTSTVMRLMKNLNYESYNDMRKDLYKVSLHKYQSTWWHLQNSFESARTKKSETLQQVWNEVIDLMKQTLNEKLQEDFQKAIQLIVKANQINVLGLRTSLAPALYLGYLIQEFSQNVQQLSLEGDFIYDRVFRLTKNDTVIIIAISPYATRTIEIAQYCYERKIPIILITDYLSCPIAAHASAILKTEPSKRQYSIVPAIAIIESLVIELGRKTSDKSINQLSKLGDMLNEKKITRT